jgi:hypothetical protein
MAAAAPRIFGAVVTDCAIASWSWAAAAAKAGEAATPRRMAAMAAKAVPASAAQATPAATITLVAAVPVVSSIVVDPAAAPEWLLVPSTAVELRALSDRGAKAATAAQVAPSSTATALVVEAPGAGITARVGVAAAPAVITAANQVVAAAADRRTSSPARSAFKLGKDGKRPQATVLSS